MSLSLRTLLRRNLQKALAERSPQKKVALALSGGVDSCCILFSLIECGIKPALYCYKLAHQQSEDCKRARALAKYYGLNLTIAYIPTDLQLVLDDIKTLLRLGVRGKVCLQCCQGHLHISPLVVEDIIFNGSGIDALYGSYTHYLKAGAQKSKEIFDALRSKALAKPNDDGMLDQQKVYGLNKTEVIFPYRQSNVIKFLMAKSWDEINQPRRKSIIVDSYPIFRIIKGLWRPRGSQQIVSGTRDLHDRLLNDKAVNKKGRKRVQELYKDIANELEI